MRNLAQTADILGLVNIFINLKLQIEKSIYFLLFTI